MSERTPIETTNLDRYGSIAIPWSRPRDILAGGKPQPGQSSVAFFLGTSRPDGRPHAAGIGAVWLDGDVFFTSGSEARKARNLAANPACTVSTSLDGIDLILEGTATQVTDLPTLEALASRYREGGWPVEVAGDAFTAPYSAPSAGPPPWQLYRFTIHTAFGVATAEPHGATRWRFER